MTTDFVIVIPARFASTRLPGKPLLDIGGKTMLQRVVEQAKKSCAREVWVATDDERIVKAAQSFGARICRTRTDHVSGTDRLQEVAQQQRWPDDTIIINVQGDEPLIPPAVINQVAENLARAKEASIATLCERIIDVDVFRDPNAVKVVFDENSYALYFSRAPIPWPRDAFRISQQTLPANHAAFRHIGIYAYKTAFLHQFVRWPPALIEQSESLEQLRALAHGVRIHVQEACEPVPGGVDTDADLQQVRNRVARETGTLT